MPVVEHRVQGLEVFGRGARRLLRIRALVDVPVVLEAVFERCPAHELPHALGFRPRKRVRLEGAFDERHVSEIQGEAFGPEHVLNHGEVLGATAQPFFQIVLQPPGKELDVCKNTRIQRDVDVVNNGLKVVGDRLLRFGRGRWMLEGRDGEQIVDRGWFGGFLGKAVRLRQRGQFMTADPLYQAIEMGAELRGRRVLRRATSRSTSTARSKAARAAVK